jgi:hypothetical protein
MRDFVGRPVVTTMYAYGQPEEILEFPDGSRAYQYRWAGGNVVRATTASSGRAIGDLRTIATTATPAMVFESAGCRVTFLARDSGKGFVVEDFRVPTRSGC